MRKRTITTLIGVLIFLGVFVLDSLQIVKGSLFFNIAMLICSFLMCHEFFDAMEKKEYKPIKIIGYLCTLLLVPIGIIKNTSLMFMLTCAIPFIIFAGMCVSVFSNLKYTIADISVTIFGTIYTVLMMSFLCLTRAFPLGVFLIFYIFCGSWFSDIFAYLIGRFFGKHKVSTISPKKSVEGCVAGVFGTILFFLIYSACLNNMDFNDFKEVSAEMSSIVQVQDEEREDNTLTETAKEDALEDIANDEDIKMPQKISELEMQNKLKKNFYTNYPLIILLAIIVSVVSQIGDFAASGIKRYCEIKDFSNLMPGHGGMLDRFDSILFVAPIVYYAVFVVINI